jgi:hypothetical protein
MSKARKTTLHTRQTTAVIGASGPPKTKEPIATKDDLARLLHLCTDPASLNLWSLELL